jgi:hypothetical protein
MSKKISFFRSSKGEAEGERQEIETLINEEALLLAMYVRGEKHNWNPRMARSLKAFHCRQFFWF